MRFVTFREQWRRTVSIAVSDSYMTAPTLDNAVKCLMRAFFRQFCVKHNMKAVVISWLLFGSAFAACVLAVAESTSIVNRVKTCEQMSVITSSIRCSDLGLCTFMNEGVNNIKIGSWLLRLCISVISYFICSGPQITIRRARNCSAC